MMIKSNKGITLISLTIYVVIMLAVIGVMAVFKTNIDKTIDSMGDNASLVPEINKMHMYMLGEAGIEDNKVLKRNSDGTYIVFSSGNDYMFSNNNVYKNSIKVISNIRSCTFEVSKENNNDVLYVNIGLGEEDTFNKRLKYVINSANGDYTGIDTSSRIPIATSDKIKIGDFVNYSVTVDGVVYDKWRVLHKDINGHVEIVCYNGPAYALGAGNDSITTDATIINKAKNDYANYIQLLNTETLPYVDGLFGISARHLGSNPTAPDSYETINVNYLKYYSDYNASTNRPISNLEYLEQNHYLTDVEALNKFNTETKLFSNYTWLASRCTYATYAYTSFNSNVYVNSENQANGGLCYLYSTFLIGDQYTNTGQFALAPVVSLESGICVIEYSGNGSEESPWKLTL